jgi:hypothetical protein
MWTETILYRFASGSDGKGSQNDQGGNLYTKNNGGSPGNGIVFRLTSPSRPNGTWTETVLHRFMTNEGTSPRAAVILTERACS